MSSKDWRPTAFVETAPGGITEEEADTNRRAQRRSLLAFVQRLVALDAAALLLVVTLVEKAFAQPQRREWVGVAVGGVATLMLNAGRRGPSSDPRPSLAAAGATFLCFVVGIAALAAFFLANWLR